MDTYLPGLQDVLAGGLVGFALGLIGGGGSILAVPLLLYVVGVPSVHAAIGTSALAVAVNAGANLMAHARASTVKWPCAGVFAGAGVAGAVIGSTVGKNTDGDRLLILFALVMMAVGIAMLRPRVGAGNPAIRINPRIAARLIAIGLLTGVLSGFFGIGGGFLIVPGLILASGMPLLNAIGSSLFSVAAFGLATAANYASSALIEGRLAAEFIAGGVAGGWVGMRSALVLGRRKRALNYTFAGVIFAVALYMLGRSGTAIGIF